jgi:hypothetical protein
MTASVCVPIWLRAPKDLFVAKTDCKLTWSASKRMSMLKSLGERYEEDLEVFPKAGMKLEAPTWSHWMLVSSCVSFNTVDRQCAPGRPPGSELEEKLVRYTCRHRSL